jgi:hypothetical protein
MEVDYRDIAFLAGFSLPTDSSLRSLNLISLKRTDTHLIVLRTKRAVKMAGVVPHLSNTLKSDSEERLIVEPVVAV